MPRGLTRSVAVVGAGMAGLSAARALHANGLAVTVFEKSRGRGGRMATRRTADDAGGWRFDHGAQYFTARTPEFRADVERWVASGAAARWTGRVVELPGGADRPGTRFLGVPGMSGIGAVLAEGLSVRFQTRLAAAERASGSWRLRTTEDEMAGPFDVVLVATPAEQAVPLLAAAPDLAARAAAVRTSPCWAVLLGLADRLTVPWDAADVAAGPLAWVARDTSKPGRARADGGEAWVLQAHSEWSEARLDAAPEDVATELAAALADAAGAALPAIARSAAHLWRYARTETPLGASHLWDAGLRIGACGDWCLGARVEAAYLSGGALAGVVLAG